MAERMLHRVEDGAEHLRSKQRGPDGHVPAGEGLRDGEDVRLEAPVLAGEHLSRAPEARRDLVHAEERPVAAAERLGALEVPVLGEPYAVADDRLGDEHGHVLGAELGFEGVEVVERHRRETREQRPEPSGERRPAVRGQGAERQPVETVLDGDDA